MSHNTTRSEVMERKRVWHGVGCRDGVKTRHFNKYSGASAAHQARGRAGSTPVQANTGSPSQTQLGVHPPEPRE